MEGEGDCMMEEGVKLESKHLLRCEAIFNAGMRAAFEGGSRALLLHLYPDLAELCYWREWMHWFYQ